MFNQNVTQGKIQRVADEIVEGFDPEKIILFGSYAWGKPDENSDIDLFVVKETTSQRQLEYNIRMKLLGNNFPPIDFVIYTPNKLNQRLKIGDYFIRHIIDRGKIIYER